MFDANFDRTVVPVLLNLVTEMSKSLDQSAVLISPSETENVSFAVGTHL
jgi:hypothetical protein